jgi:hypothetical protein
VPCPQLRVLGLLADDRILHDGVAEMIHHRRDGEYAPQPLIQTFLRRGFLRGFLGLRVGVISPPNRLGRGSAPALRLGFVL